MHFTLTKSESKRLLNIDASSVEIWKGHVNDTFITVQPAPTFSERLGILLGTLFAIPQVLFTNRLTLSQLKDDFYDEWVGSITVYAEHEFEYYPANEAYYHKLNKEK